MLKNYIAAIVAGILVMAAQFSFSKGADRAGKWEAAAMTKKAAAGYRQAGDKTLGDFVASGRASVSKYHYANGHNMAAK
jgi:hypothetical protein